jgi:hypothetical protein
MIAVRCSKMYDVGIEDRGMIVKVYAAESNTMKVEKEETRTSQAKVDNSTKHFLLTDGSASGNAIHASVGKACFRVVQRQNIRYEDTG